MFSFANPDPLPPPIGKIDPNLTISVMTFNSIGITMALALATFCIVHRKAPVIRASNPFLSLMVLFGCICAHCGIVASSAVPDERVAIQLTAYLVAGGYTIIFAAIVAKMGLIYWIISAKRRMNATSLKLVMAVLTCLTVQMVLIYSWFSNDVKKLNALVVGGTTWMVLNFSKTWALVCALPVLLLTGLACIWLISFVISRVTLMTANQQLSPRMPSR
ncbi:hypothetical protein BCR44DRAFT_1103856 [Catenaria anguillulae PL171]|uniref:G-protein coupled receptors family 3 profile domain-containing protein n=1 Tax=Catenaria anguillulae PL171 TaxID=765915 RepID=A0A1Y2I471_9FUNG|nr:hypothetical protein BCR44DRAFT_1103856 [Catenaria anguillulae PL171]